jgi:lysophospholipase
MDAVAMPIQSRCNRRAVPDGVVESQWFAPDGWPIRRADWPLPDHPRGALLFVPGRGDFFEKYIETLDSWHRAGWAVTALDWRGQAASGRLGDDPVTGHVDDFAIWISDLKSFWGDWAKAAPPGRQVLVGHSMGGHLALRAVAEGAVRPDGLVLSAPMLGLITRGLPLVLLHWVAKFMRKIKGPRCPAWKWSEKPGEVPAERVNLLTHDPERYADELWWREHRPELTMGPASWGWVAASIASMRGLDRREVLARVTIPVFLFATGADELVGIAACDRAAHWLPNVQYLRFGAEARHEILREVDPVRDRAVAGIDAFLDRLAPRAE